MPTKLTFTLHGIADTREVFLNGEPLMPGRSIKVMNHSPDGFNWGYGGSGPAQLALAIMLELVGHGNGYQDFKWSVISYLPQNKDFSKSITYTFPDADPDGRFQERH